MSASPTREVATTTAMTQMKITVVPAIMPMYRLNNWCQQLDYGLEAKSRAGASYSILVQT